MISKWRNVASLLSVSAVVFAIDKISKRIVVTHLRAGESIPIVSGIFQFKIALQFNNGFGFGILSDSSHHTKGFVIGGMVVAMAIILVALVSIGNRITMITIWLALYLGCILGNLVDKVASGAALDFLEIDIYRLHWPAFNFADSAATVGDILLLLFFLCRRSSAAAQLNELKGVFAMGRTRERLRSRF
jgi:signal peptidase II